MEQGLTIFMLCGNPIDASRDTLETAYIVSGLRKLATFPSVQGKFRGPLKRQQ
jgi:hypothetical protein